MAGERPTEEVERGGKRVSCSGAFLPIDSRLGARPLPRPLLSTGAVEEVVEEVVEEAAATWLIPVRGGGLGGGANGFAAAFPEDSAVPPGGVAPREASAEELGADGLLPSAAACGSRAASGAPPEVDEAAATLMPAPVSSSLALRLREADTRALRLAMGAMVPRVMRKAICPSSTHAGGSSAHSRDGGVDWQRRSHGPEHACVLLTILNGVSPR